MDKVDILYNEYSELKSICLKDNSLEAKENLKNKLIELDYQINKEYEENLNLRFPMTTTIEKEEARLEGLITYIKKKIEEQKQLIDDYKKITGKTIELSYLKSSDKLIEYKDRLSLVKKLISLKKDLIKLVNNPKESNNAKIKVIKNKLLKKEMLNLLYEFCLIDSLDITDINIEKITSQEENKKENPKQENEKNIEKKEQPKEEVKEIKELPKEEKQEQIKQEVIIPQQEEPVKEEENNILTSMPQLEKLGTVTPVNVFESIKKTEEKLPDVVIPSNGLTEENTEIFIDTKQYFN